VIVNYVYDRGCATGEALLERYHSLTGWAEALVQAGARVTVLQRFIADEVIERAGVCYHLIGDRLRPALYAREIPFRLHRMLDEFQPEIVHLNGLCFPAQTLALALRVPRQTTLMVQHHAERPPGASGWREQILRGLTRAALRRADGFIFTSEPQAAEWRSIGAIGPMQKVWAVPEASTRLKPLPYTAARAASGLRGEPAFLWVGHLNTNKDPLTVLAGFALALPALPKAHLTMIYVGEQLLSEVQKRIAYPDLQGRVTLQGKVGYEKMVAYYSAADYFVSGSHREGSGYALIEALACGATPIVTDIPSFRALMSNGAIGLLWPVGDSEALAAALMRLVQNDQQHERQAALAHFAQYLSWQRVGELALKAYGEARPLASKSVSW
jgi:glycosyltransferase involved in cell wall biosynthesis